MQPDLTHDTLADRLRGHCLEILGGFACASDEAGLPQGTRTVVLLGPAQPGFWPHLQTQPEWDGAADPIDRWSRRVIGRLACDLGAKALFPFGGPPWHPFQTWALRSGRAWQSPVRFLVHDSQGLMVSFRGALALKQALQFPAAPPSPCTDCPAPCRTACPPRALTAAGYDVPACHGFLDQPAGSDCMSRGCAVRRACPVSARHARMPEQSAYHMRQFHR
jgi:epoxyqueuosine reductase